MTDTQQPPSAHQPWRPSPPPAPQPPLQQPPTRSNGLATSGFIVALIGLLVAFGPGAGGALSWLLFLVGLGLSIAGVALAGQGRGGRGLAATGIVLSVFSLVLSVGHSASSTSGSSSYSSPSSSSGYRATTAPSTIAAPSIPLRTYKGTGDDVVTLDKPAGAGVMTFSCPKCTSNTVVKSDGRDSLLVNTIGSYAGKRWLDTAGGTTTRMEIKAKGSWTLTVGGLDQATKASGSVTGTGDDVVLLNSATTTAAITNRGASNFVVETVSANGDTDLAVNEIGSYSGTVALDAPALIQVTSEGTWTITPR